MKKTILLLSILIIGNLANCQSLSLREYLNLIIKNDSSYKNIFVESRKTKAQMIAASAMFGWQFESSLSKSFFKEMTQGSSSMNDMNTLAVDANFSKMFKTTGTMFKAGYSYDSSDMSINMPGPTTIEKYSPAIYISLNQPILKNNMGALNRYPIDKLKIINKLSDINQKENQENYFKSAINLYYDWVSSYLSIQNMVEHYTNIKDLHKQMESQYKNDLITKSDLLQSKERLLMTEENLKMMLAQFNILTKMISDKAGLDYVENISWDSIALEPGEYKETYNTAIKGNSRTEQTFDIMLEGLKLDRWKADEDAKTDLSTFANLKIYDSSASNSKLLTSTMDKVDYTVGVSAKFDLEQITHKGKQDELQAEKDNLMQQKDTAIRMTNIGIKKISLQLKQNDSYVTSMHNIIEWNKERVELEMKRYNSGLTQFFNLVNVQNDLVNNKTTYLSAIINGYKYRVELMSAKDTLLDKIESLIKE